MPDYKVRLVCDVFVNADNEREAVEFVTDEMRLSDLDFDEITTETEIWSD